VGLAFLVYFSGQWQMHDNAIGANAVKIAATKAAIPFWEAFFKAILCNILVCLAVWLALAGRTVTDRILAVIFPVSAFVAAGFEHSVANMYFIPLGILLQQHFPDLGATAVSWSGLVDNLVPVTLGNIAGGGGMVAAVYHLVYHRSCPD
jgi:formate/nitrite transporter